MDFEEFERISLDIREDVVDMIALAGSGHTAPSLSCVDIMVSLYYDFPKSWERFVLSKGHAAPVLYAISSRRGIMPRDELKKLRKNGGLEGHPAYRPEYGIEASTGILGVGWAEGLGMALTGYPTVVLSGDGEFQEGLPKEVLETAVQYKAGKNLHIIIDNNNYQLDSKIPDTLKIADVCRGMGCDVLGKEWSAYECKKIPVVDGHDFGSLQRAFNRAFEPHDRPVVVIANTVKGKGVRAAEQNPVKYHGEPLKGDAYKNAKGDFAAQREKMGGWKYVPIVEL